jgi:NADPH:quinone reductase-like Zn-dependent oxidoreductase
MGTVAEFVSINSELVAKNPKLFFEEAAGLPLTGLTAIQALERLALKRTIESYSCRFWWCR